MNAGKSRGGCTQGGEPRRVRYSYYPETEGDFKYLMTMFNETGRVDTEILKER